MIFGLILPMSLWVMVVIFVLSQIEGSLMETLKDNFLRKYAGDEAVDEYSKAWNYAFVEVVPAFTLHCQAKF